MNIPNITTKSGQVLTIQNWQSIGIDTISCDLSALLVKPGIEVLKQIGKLKNYWNWQGKICLNISGAHQIRSPFDGRKLQFSEAEINALIDTLAPDQIIDSAIDGNKPAEDAIKGMIYTEAGPVSIQDKVFRLDFNKLVECCSCPACDKNLTRAYFHHLFSATPLLCLRWLIMHNYVFGSNSSTSAKSAGKVKSA